jgi:hypothetical protein
MKRTQFFNLFFFLVLVCPASRYQRELLGELSWLQVEREKLMSTARAAQEANFKKDIEVENAINNLTREVEELEDLLAAKCATQAKGAGFKVSSNLEMLAA